MRYLIFCVAYCNVYDYYLIDEQKRYETKIDIKTNYAANIL